MTLRKGLVLFLLLSFGVSAVVLLSSVDSDTWSTILRADKRLLLLALVFVLSAWACDASRFCALARSAGEKIDFKLGMVLTWLHYFGCAVTPMQSGGGPFQVYVLYKRKVPLGKGIAITLTRTLLTILILGIVVPVAVFIEPELLRGDFSSRESFLTSSPSSLSPGSWWCSAWRDRLSSNGGAGF